MAERVAVDPAVDELRRKARRRLVGAIVLALAAAVILPMVLEKEPRPLGEDVAVRIPPVDDSKFVNRLSPGGDTAKGKDAAPSPSSQGAATAPRQPVASAPSASTDTKSPPAADASASPNTPTPTVPAATESVTKSDAAAPPEPAAKSDTAKTDAAPSAAKPEPIAKAEPRPAGDSSKDARADTKPADSSSKTATGFVVQLAAFSDDKGANALASKLKRNGYPAFTEPIQTSRGTLYRVRVGSYGSREAAADARNKLKGDGYAGIVAPAH